MGIDVGVSSWIRKIDAVWRDRRGNVATIFALALLPISVLTGGTVDYSMAMNARTRLAQSLDAAALAVGVNVSASAEDAAGIANDFMAANYPGRELGSVTGVTVSIDDASDTVTVYGESVVQTLMLGIIGIETITVHWESEVSRARQNLEMVMVLDNTGSMGGSKIRDLRTSAGLLNEILFEAATEPDDVRIGLVPFASTVNVGTQYERAWWLDPNALSPEHAAWAEGPLDVETCVTTGRRRNRRTTCTVEEDVVPNHWDLFDQMPRENWGGCVEARAIPMDIDDTTPNAGRPETLFVPYFSPDEPERNGYYNSYLSDGVGGSDRDRMRNLSKYENARANRGGPNEGCTTTPITPITNSESTVDLAISSMQASGATNIPNGIGWGVRVLSPSEPFTGGTAFDDRSIIKAMVILTDGENYYRGGRHYYSSAYSAYGYSFFGRLGTRSASSRRLASELNARTEAACDYAKSLGIRVYTITFQVNSSTTRALMEDCATNPTLYFDSPSSSALRDAFEMIAGDLSNLRLSR
ncbi:MAG: pilus assembly protein [Maricaulis sp.]|jgi:Flp pilus assembly protein TadG|nr:pilus assembly protein [Maricaulis sp.]MDG2043163.1 pilus assembly protein [Maricaulis sp.]